MVARLSLAARQLEPGGLLAATFASTRDPRFGRGIAVEAWSFAAEDGDERGVTHAFFDEPALRAALTPHFTIESLEEHPAAHGIHWFVVAHRR
ncbi:MAG TPA: hypothetical protein VMH02_06760 [Verrucomicrobiae bacterium]|nr:hypothetical protein [Verrucomicrobiae bacterium]